MSKISNVENGAVYEGYDYLSASEWCTPSFLGCSMCVAASAVKGQVTVTLGLKTPFGNVSKSFSFNSNVSYTWQPFSKFKITVSITNFNEAGGVFSFDLGLNPCVDVPFLGWKCFNYSHTFSVPLLLHGIQNEIDDSQFSSILALHAGGAFKEQCQCDDHSNSGSTLLQGDIYSNYLKNQGAGAGFPTIPITKCLPIPTVQCIPTITSCVTGISPICLAQNETGSNAPNAGFPTIPITKCLPIPTVQCIPTITSCVTGISPICLAQNQVGSSAPNAGFPTIPITQCLPIPTVQCIPTITSCMTGISPICLAQNQVGSNAPNAGFPTIPITQCLPIPTVQCIPTITSCVTGISPICLAQNNAGNAKHDTAVNVANIPTLPVNQCVPTVQCIPTLSCIPTATCTGIPFICS